MKTIRQKIRRLAPVALALAVMATLPAAAQTSDELDAAELEAAIADAIVRVFRMHAEKGDAEAQNNLGGMYQRGESVPRDHAEAAHWYRRSAEQGHANAQFNLGITYVTGEGMPQDHAEAARWFRRSAEQGDAIAQNNLGAMYYEGQGVPQDFAEAARWLRHSAEQGDAIAQLNLGGMYELGHGVAQNFVQAHKWLNLAASQLGTSDQDQRDTAVRSRDRVAALLSPTEIAEAQRLAREWRPGQAPD
ncbi:MAG: tetratricopeptide repeat protein [Alphaproteobacteria bacterium]|nr:tetratricopeptide repeat protein [Alphaproteobacteria bacterium]